MGNQKEPLEAGEAANDRVLRAVLIGHPIRDSWSPPMQTAAFAATGIGAHYELWDTSPEQLGERVAALRGQDMLGANITIPYKNDVRPLLDAVSHDVELALGAVNTVVVEKTAAGPRLVGHNTDVAALRRILDEERPGPGNNNLLVIGAGGAARAALAVAWEKGFGTWLAVRNPEAGRDLVRAFQQRQVLTTLEREKLPGMGTWATPQIVDLADSAALSAVIAHTSIVVQSTPIGTGDRDASPVPLPLIKQLPPYAFVLDVVYNPPDTALVRQALSQGLHAIGGLAMLLYQGADAFSLWTGLAAPLTEMRLALERLTVLSRDIP